MIVRDGGKDLARCLDSAGPWVDEIVVVDTGSTDRSRQVAAAAGAQVLQHPWVDDFAAARNQSLDACTGRWILVLDADEALAPRDGRELRRWVEEADRRGELVGAEIETRNYQVPATGLRGWTPVPADDPHALPGGPPAPGFVPTCKVRVFPNHPEIRFEGCLHELVDHSLRRLGGRLEKLDLPVHHFGCLARSTAKARRYLELARRKTAANPLDLQAWSELADCCQNAGEPEQARAALEQARKQDPDSPVLRLKLGLLLYEAGDWPAATVQLTAAADLPSASDQQRAEARHTRALIAIGEDRLADALPDLQAAVRLAPAEGLYWNSFGAWHLLNRDGHQARTTLEKALALLPGHADPPLNLGIL